MFNIKEYKIIKETNFLDGICHVASATVTAFPGVGKSTLLNIWKSKSTCYGDLIDLDFGYIRTVYEDEMNHKISSYSKTVQNLVQQFYVSTAEVLSSANPSASNRNVLKPNLILCNVPDIRYEAMIIPHINCDFTYVQNVKKRDPKNPFAQQYEKNFRQWVLGWFNTSFLKGAAHQVLYILTDGIYLSDMYKGNTEVVKVIVHNEQSNFSKEIRLVVRPGKGSKALSLMEPILKYLNWGENAE